MAGIELVSGLRVSTPPSHACIAPLGYQESLLLPKDQLGRWQGRSQGFDVMHKARGTCYEPLSEQNDLGSLEVGVVKNQTFLQESPGVPQRSLRQQP